MIDPRSMALQHLSYPLHNCVTKPAQGTRRNRTESFPPHLAAILNKGDTKSDNVDEAVPIGIETVSNPLLPLQDRLPAFLRAA